MATIQNLEAPRVLEIIRTACASHQFLRYQQVAVDLGRDPRTNARAVAQICDLLDAAAAHARVPLLAMVIVHNAEGEINPMAWKKDSPPGLRDEIIKRSLAHTFVASDFDAIGAALVALKGLGNHAAWRRVIETFGSREALYESLVAGEPMSPDDSAIDDLDSATRQLVVGYEYKRDPAVRARVVERSQGRCEYCNSAGFLRDDGSRYVETHHIIRLADDGADLESNVIALCANHHKEAHFGHGREAMEEEFVAIVSKKLAIER